MVEVPEECKELVKPMEALLARVSAAVKVASRGGRAVDFAHVEVDLADATAAIERTANGIALRGLDIDASAVIIDGVRHTRAGRSRATYYTLAGPVEIERTLYRERNKPTVDAVSRRAGVVGAGWLPHTARAMAQQVARIPSREAEGSGRELRRLMYSRSAFEDVAHLVGEHYVATHQDVEEALIEEFQIPDEAASVSVSLDRVSVPMEEPRPRPRGRPRKDAPKRPVTRAFRMAYCGTVTLHDATGESLHTIRYGTMPAHDPKELVVGLAGDVCALLQKKPGLAVASLCDGAPEMGNQLDEELNEASIGKPMARLVDFHHLIEKLAPAARVVSGEDGKATLARWRLSLLNRNTAAELILAELQASGLEHTKIDGGRPVHDAITYFENHRGMFGYKAAREAGLPIGSGNVEATCKSLFEIRLKRGGARWKEDSGEHIVHLRAAVLSDRWGPAITRTLAPLRQAVRAAA